MTSSNLAIEKGTCCGELTHPTWRKAKSFIIFKMVGRYVSSQEGTMFFSLGLLLTKPYLRSDGEWHLVKWQSNPVKGDGERPYQAKNSWDFSQRVSVIIRLNIQLSNQHISQGGCFTVSSMLSSGIVVDTCWIADINPCPPTNGATATGWAPVLLHTLLLGKGPATGSGPGAVERRRSSMAGSGWIGVRHQQNDHVQKIEYIFNMYYIYIWTCFMWILTCRIIPRIQN